MSTVDCKIISEEWLYIKSWREHAQRKSHSVQLFVFPLAAPATRATVCSSRDPTNGRSLPWPEGNEELGRHEADVPKDPRALSLIRPDHPEVFTVAASLVKY